jgi:cell division protein FtsN
MHNTYTTRKQNGNTLLGLVIGLIIGLVVAVVVALVITKGQSPFTSKGKLDKLAEPAGNQISDPNRPMYGNRDAAREASKELAGRAAAVVPNAAPQAAAATTTATATAAKPAAPAADEEKATYYLQAGAFRDQADAESARAKLALLGFEANISDKGGDGGPLFRVRVGPFNNADAMNRVKTKLSESGVDVAVVRNAR